MEQKPRYRPLSVHDVTDYDPMHGTIRAKRVNFVLSDGSASYVVIPLSDYTPERVKEEMEKTAQAHDAVMMLQGPPETPAKHRANNPFG